MRLKIIRMWRLGSLTQARLPHTLRRLQKVDSRWTKDDLEKLRQFFNKCRKYNDRLIYRYMQQAVTKDEILSLEGEVLTISKTARLKVKKLIEEGLI